MAKIKNMGSSTMRFNEGIIVSGSAGTDTHSLVTTGSIQVEGDLNVRDVATYNTIEYFNSNTMKFNQYYLGNANGTYFTANEYQKVITIIPSANSQNYQVIGRITAQNAGETHTVYFNASLRSETLPDLSWTILYDEEYNGNRYIDPQLWVKETTTAGFIFAFKTLGTIYGNVTVDIDVVPRASDQKTNVTINNSVSSEQTAVDAGYTAYDMTKVFSKKGQDLTIGGVITANAFTGSATQAVADQIGETLVGGVFEIDQGLFQNPSNSTNKIYFPSDDSYTERVQPSSVNFFIAPFNGELIKIQIRSTGSFVGKSLTASLHTATNGNNAYNSTPAVSVAQNGLSPNETLTFDFSNESNTGFSEGDIYGFSLELSENWYGGEGIHFTTVVKYNPYS